MFYREEAKRTRDVASELDVQAVVEMSVRRAGDDMRFTVQLIDGETERHLWSNTYDQRYSAAGMFAIQADIARQVSAELRVQLTGEEEQRLAGVPTENDQAYELYVRAAYYKRLRGPGPREQHAELLRQALRLDPEFGIAWAELARILTIISYNEMLGSGITDVAEEAAAALARAEELAPAAAETRAARGVWHYYVEYDLAAARESFRRAVQLKPSDPDIHHFIALVERRAGNWDAVLAAHAEELARDPLAPLRLSQTDGTYCWLRDFTSGQRLLERLPPTQATLSRIVFHVAGRTGDLDSLRQWLDSASAIFESDSLAQARALLAYYERDFERAGGLRATGMTIFQEQKCYVLGDLECLREHGDTLLARAHRGLSALDASPNVVSSEIRASLERNMGRAYAIRGDRDAAVEWATRALDTHPITIDAWQAGTSLMHLSIVYIILEEHEAAIETLDQALSIPGKLSANHIKLDPFYDSLRRLPGFQALLEKYEG